MNPREDLKAFADRELNPEQMQIVQKLLDQDPAAREELAQIESLSQSIQAEAQTYEPHGLENVLARLEAAPQPKRAWWTGWPRLVAGTAGIIVLGALLFPMFAPAKFAAKSGDVMADRSVESAKMSMPSEEGAMDGFAGKGMGGAAASAPMDNGLEMKSKSMAQTPQMDKMRSTAGGAFPPQTGLVIRNGNIAVKVEDAERAQKETIRLARELGGYVEDSTLFRNPDGTSTASLALRVPENRFESGLEALARLGDVENRSVTGQDVTTQVVDMDARVRALKAEEEQYLTLLKATRRIGDILIVKDRLSQVRMQIESIDAQRKNLRNQAAYSLISASFTEKPKAETPKSSTWTDDTWNVAVNRLGKVGEFLGKAIINVFVFAPVWIPLLLLAWWGAKRTR